MKTKTSLNFNINASDPISILVGGGVFLIILGILFAVFLSSFITLGPPIGMILIGFALILCGVAYDIYRNQR